MPEKPSLIKIQELAGAVVNDEAATKGERALAHLTAWLAAAAVDLASETIKNRARIKKLEVGFAELAEATAAMSEGAAPPTDAAPTDAAPTDAVPADDTVPPDAAPPRPPIDEAVVAPTRVVSRTPAPAAPPTALAVAPAPKPENP